MKLKALTGGALALAMMTTSVAATAAPVSVRAGSVTTDKSELAGGGGIFAILIAAGVAAIGIVAIVKDDNSDSN
ncbi:hypothetical protein [Sphingomonas faeni]|uniref:hypothetical protein n=1 Tax=Sphingomonas faeni TaxID=185950 RepID=UPI0033542061